MTSDAPSRHSLRSRLAPRLAIVLVFAVFAALYVALKAKQFVAFGTSFELADYGSMLASVSRGRLLDMPGTPTSFLADHFQPVLLLLAPLHALAPSPWTLLVAHALAAAAGALPLYALAARFTSRRWPPLAFALAYLLSRVTLNGLMYDVHPEVLYPACFFAALLALEERRWWSYAFALVLAGTVKEDACVAFLGLGAYAALRGHRRAGLATAVAGVALLALVVGVVSPHFRGPGAGADYRFAAYWSGYGATQHEILRNFLDPRRHAQVILTPAKLRQMFHLLAPFLLLPLASWRALVALVLPQLFLLYSSDNGLLNGPILYYGMLALPFLFASALAGAEAIARRFGPRREAALSVLATLVLLATAGDSRLPRLVAGLAKPVPERYASVAPRLARTLPADARVCAQAALLPHVAVSPDRTVFPLRLERANVVFLDLEGNPWPYDLAGLARAADSLAASGAWRVRTRESGFVVLERTAPN